MNGMNISMSKLSENTKDHTNKNFENDEQINLHEDQIVKL